jgi:hypothetical protein
MDQAKHDAIQAMWQECLDSNDWSSFSRSMVIESEWDNLSNELQSDYQDYDQYEDAEWVLNSRIYTDSHIDRWS